MRALTLLAGIFDSARTLSEPWETLTRLNPIYYVVDATWGGFAGFHESPLWRRSRSPLSSLSAPFCSRAALLARGWRLAVAPGAAGPTGRSSALNRRVLFDGVGIRDDAS